MHKKQPLLSQQLQIAEQVNDALRLWLQQEREIPLLAYLLEHDYSEQNLSLDNQRIRRIPASAVTGEFDMNVVVILNE